MTERQEILSDFIKRIFKKAKTNRRHNKNSIANLTDLTNKAFELYLGKKYGFTEEEVLEGFDNNNFTILEAKDKNSIMGDTVKGKIVFSSGYYVNVNSQNISDLASSLRKGFPLKSNDDTILRINNTKTLLKQFSIEKALFK